MQEFWSICKARASLGRMSRMAACKRCKLHRETHHLNSRTQCEEVTRSEFFFELSSVFIPQAESHNHVKTVELVQAGRGSRAFFTCLQRPPPSATTNRTSTSTQLDTHCNTFLHRTPKPHISNPIGLHHRNCYLFAPTQTRSNWLASSRLLLERGALVWQLQTQLPFHQNTQPILTTLIEHCKQHLIHDGQHFSSSKRC